MRIHFIGLTLIAGIAQAQAQTTPAITSVVNGASYRQGIARGSWVTITGSNLSSTTRTWTSADIVNGKLPTSLDGVSVTIDGSAAAIYYVSGTQVNVLAPASNSTGTVAVSLKNSSGTATASTDFQQAAPALFASATGGKSYAIVTNSSSSLVSHSAPVAPGDTVVLYGTGFGTTSPSVDALSDFSGAAQLTDLTALTVTIGGKAAVVSWAGLIGNGLYQINAVVDSGVADGDAAVTVAVSGTAGKATSYLPISASRKQVTAKVACLGDSITAITTYPTTLQTQLGSSYAVTNYGVPGTTVISTSGRSYSSQSQYSSAKQALPDIVVIMLGTNDTSSSVYSSIGQFPSDYEKMISELQALDSHPRIWIVKPPPIYTNTIGVVDANLTAGVIPGIVQAGSASGIPVIDANTPLQGHSEYFSDGVHPNSTGATILATQISTAVQ